MKLTMGMVTLALFSALELSCSVGPLATMTGETASIRLQHGASETVEIIAVEDSSILCLPASPNKLRTTSRVKEISTDSIARIEVSGFRNSNWWVGVVVFEVLPAAGLAAAAASANADAGEVFAVTLIPAAFTTLLYAVSGVPTPTFEEPLSTEKLLELRKYARFGGKLTASQKEELLGKKGRTESQ